MIDVTRLRQGIDSVLAQGLDDARTRFYVGAVVDEWALHQRDDAPPVFLPLDAIPGTAPHTMWYQTTEKKCCHCCLKTCCPNNKNEAAKKALELPVVTTFP